MAKIKSRRYTLIFLLLIFIIAICYSIISIKKDSKPKVSPNPTATITQLHSTDDKNKNINTSSGINQGTSTDTHGSTNNINSLPDQWVQSQSGVITVKNPLINSSFKSGDSLGGSANVNKVQYRLIDNMAGVISQGFINVYNNNFSANISFPYYSNSGRLDVFSTNSNGAEINEVQINLILSK